jgi:hypothetical protein
MQITNEQCHCGPTNERRKGYGKKENWKKKMMEKSDHSRKEWSTTNWTAIYIHRKVPQLRFGFRGHFERAKNQKMKRAIVFSGGAMTLDLLLTNDSHWKVLSIGVIFIGIGREIRTLIKQKQKKKAGSFTNNA